MVNQSDNHPRHNAEHDTASRRPAIFLSAAVLLIALVSAAIWFVYGYSGIYPGVSSLDVNGGFLSTADFTSALTEKSSGMYDDEQISVSIGKGVYNMNVSDLGVTVNVPKTVFAAQNYGRDGNFFQRFGSIIKGAVAGEDIPAQISVNSDSLRAEINNICNTVNSQIGQPLYSVDNEYLYINTATLGSVADPDELFEIIYNKLSSGDFSPVTYLAFISEDNNVDYRSILEKVATLPQNAYIDNESDPSGNTIVPHVNGISFDIDNAVNLLENSTENTVRIPITITVPEITTESLKANAFRDLLAQCETTFNANLVGRTSNMKLAASCINGLILEPGKEFSFNGTVGERSAERGYKDAKVFQGGEVVDGLGGGICQVSSTLYMAALRANLQISERRNHMYAVSYTPIGQDATVVYGLTDFRFINSLTYPIKITIEFTDNTIIVSIYGTNDTGNIVEITSSVTSKTPFQTVTVYDASLEPNKTTVVQSGYTGYRSETYRTVYDSQGNQISHELENKSTYRKLDKIVHSGDPSLAVNADASGVPSESESLNTQPEIQSTVQPTDSATSSTVSESTTPPTTTTTTPTTTDTSAASSENTSDSPIIPTIPSEPTSEPAETINPETQVPSESESASETEPSQTEPPKSQESAVSSTNRHSTF